MSERVPVAVCRAVLYCDRRAWCVPHRRVRVLFLVQADTPAAAVLVVFPSKVIFLICMRCPALDRMYLQGTSYDPVAGVSSQNEKIKETASQTRRKDAVMTSCAVLPLGVAIFTSDLACASCGSCPVVPSCVPCSFTLHAFPDAVYSRQYILHGIT